MPAAVGQMPAVRPPLSSVVPLIATRAAMTSVWLEVWALRVGVRRSSLLISTCIQTPAMRRPAQTEAAAAAPRGCRVTARLTPTCRRRRLHSSTPPPPSHRHHHDPCLHTPHRHPLHPRQTMAPSTLAPHRQAATRQSRSARSTRLPITRLISFRSAECHQNMNKALSSVRCFGLVVRIDVASNLCCWLYEADSRLISCSQAVENAFDMTEVALN